MGLFGKTPEKPPKELVIAGGGRWHGDGLGRSQARGGSAGARAPREAPVVLAGGPGRCEGAGRVMLARNFPCGTPTAGGCEQPAGPEAELVNLQQLVERGPGAGSVGGSGGKRVGRGERRESSLEGALIRAPLRASPGRRSLDSVGQPLKKTQQKVSYESSSSPWLVAFTARRSPARTTSWHPSSCAGRRGTRSRGPERS